METIIQIAIVAIGVAIGVLVAKALWKWWWD